MLSHILIKVRWLIGLSRGCLIAVVCASTLEELISFRSCLFKAVSWDRRSVYSSVGSRLQVLSILVWPIRVRLTGRLWVASNGLFHRFRSESLIAASGVGKRLGVWTCLALSWPFGGCRVGVWSACASWPCKERRQLSFKPCLRSTVCSWCGGWLKCRDVCQKGSALVRALFSVKLNIAMGLELALVCVVCGG